MSGYSKPLPTPSPDSQPFWEAARRHELRLQWCATCDHFIYYPRHRCPRCLGAHLEWRPVSGRGTIYSFTIVRRTTSKAFVQDTPYVLAIVELAEAPRLTTNIVGCAVDAVRCGMPVRVRYEDVTPDVTLVKFQPV